MGPALQQQRQCSLFLSYNIGNILEIKLAYVPTYSQGLLLINKRNSQPHLFWSLDILLALSFSFSRSESKVLSACGLLYFVVFTD